MSRINTRPTDRHSFRSRSRSRSSSRRRGAAVLEMTVAMTMLFSLVLGGIEFGYYIYAKHLIECATRDGARVAILGTATTSGVDTAISNAMTAGGLQSTGYTKAYTNASTGATITDVSTVASGTSIKITVSATFGSMNVRPLGFIPANKAVVGATTMVKE
jgi:Flp pilus assembly protein TadG